MERGAALWAIGFPVNAFGQCRSAVVTARRGYVLNKAWKAWPRDIDRRAGAVWFRTVALAMAVEGPIAIGVLIAMLPVLTVFVHDWLHSWAGVEHLSPTKYCADVRLN